MTLTDKMEQPDGWNRQAEYLAFTHAAFGMAFAAIAKQMRWSSPTRRLSSQQIPSADAGSSLKTSKNEHPNDPQLMRAKLPELERQEALRKVIARPLHGQMKTPMVHVLAVGEGLTEPEGEADPARDELICWENESRSLQTSLDLVVNENSRLCKCLGEKNATINDIYSQLEQAKAALAASEIECHKLAAALDAANEKNQIDNQTLIRCIADSNTAINREHFELERAKVTFAVTATERDKLAAALAEANEKLQIETDSFNKRLKVVSARADAAETMLAEVRQSLFDKLDRLQTMHEEKVRRVQELEDSRARLIDGASALLKTVTRRDETLAHTMETLRLLVKLPAKPGAKTDKRTQMRSAEILLDKTITF